MSERWTCQLVISHAARTLPTDTEEGRGCTSPGRGHTGWPTPPGRYASTEKALPIYSVYSSRDGNGRNSSKYTILRNFRENGAVYSRNFLLPEANG